MSLSLQTREAAADDAGSIAEIYNQGIEERTATFETEKRTASSVIEWIGGAYPVVVADHGGDVIAFAKTSPYSARKCYSGIAEFSVYVKREFRRKGAGRSTMKKLIEESEKKGFWKLLSRIFIENTGSRKLLSELGFREVGIYHNHGMLDGEWRDVVIVEYLIEKNIEKMSYEYRNP